MAFYQLLFFRKGRYKREAPTKYADKAKHRKNIRKKRKQVDNANWAMLSNSWIMLLTGGLTGVLVLVNFRERSIAKKKLSILEALYKESYNEEIPEEKERKRDILMKICGCIAAPCVTISDSDLDSIMEDADEPDKKEEKTNNTTRGNEQEDDVGREPNLPRQRTIDCSDQGSLRRDIVLIKTPSY